MRSIIDMFSLAASTLSFSRNLALSSGLPHNMSKEKQCQLITCRETDWFGKELHYRPWTPRL